MEEAFTNAIYYANHSPGALFNYRMHLMNHTGLDKQASSRPKRLKPESGFGTRTWVNNAARECEIVRATRLLQAVCKAAPRDCRYSEEAQMPESVEEIVRTAHADRSCTRELTAELRDLVYGPVEVDLGALVQEDLRH